jgi:hypothetical protein
MAGANGVWGWNGWLVAVGIPLCMWAFFVLILALVLRRSSASTAAPVSEEAASAGLRDAGTLSWRPPVPSHH